MGNLTAGKPKSLYNCMQSELYAVCTIGWDSCMEAVADFANLKAYYTTSYITDRLNEVTAAQNIPDAQPRVNVAEEIRGQLVLKSDECVMKWQTLKTYITDAFPKDALKNKLEDAGIKYYRQASKYNWEKLSQMMINGSQFIANNLAQLQANNNMPASFPAQFNQLMAEAMPLYEQFMKAQQNAETLTTEKINANNDIYSKLMKMMKDGQQIYRKDRATKERFIYSRVMKLVRGIANVYKTFIVKAGSSMIIEKVVTNSTFTNTGAVALYFCAGDDGCTPQTGTEALPKAVIPIPENVHTITVLNTDTAKKGKCRVRVTKS